MNGDERMSSAENANGLILAGRLALLDGRLGLGALLVFAIAWCFASWLLAERLVSERTSLLVEREQEAASSAASAVGTNAGFVLAHMSHIPRVLARQPEIEAVLSRRSTAVPRGPAGSAAAQALARKRRRPVASGQTV